MTYTTCPEPTTVAIVRDEDGKVYDRCFTWESGQTYANEGYLVEAVADDGSVDIATAQARYDSERAAAADCFGPGVRA